MNLLDYGTPFSATATHATAAVATVTAGDNKTHIITDVIASSDKAGAIMLVKQGTTVVLQVQVGASDFSHHFQTPIKGAKGALVSVEIDGTSACKANICGVTIDS